MTEEMKLLDKSMKMDMYLFEQTQDLYMFYYDNLKEEVLYGGHVDVGAYLLLLRNMDEEKMKDWEKRFMAEVNQLQLINDDIVALRQHLQEKQKAIVLPHWITDPQIKEEARQMLIMAEKYDTIEMNDCAAIIPVPIYAGPDFEERLREVVDVDELIEKDN